MKPTSVLKWALIIVLLAAVAGGGALCWFWVKSDQLIHQAVLDGIRAKAPGWDISVQRTRFDGASRLHLFDVAVSDPTDEKPLLVIPEVIVTLDRDQLVKNQQFIVHRVRVRDPVMRVRRLSDGSWNWQSLPAIEDQKKALPEWLIENATFDVSLDYGSHFPTARFALTGATARVVPAAKRMLDFDGRLQVDSAGDLRVVGRWDVDRHIWKLTGQMNNMVASDQLMELAARTSPDVSDRIQRFGQMVYQTAERIRSGETRVASTEGSGFEIQSGAGPAFGIAGRMNARFDIVSRGPESEPSFRVLLGLTDGTINNLILPFGLHDVSAQLYRDNELTFLHIHNARNDKTQLRVEASVSREQDGSSTGFVDLDVQELPLDDRVRRVLPVSLRRVMDPLNATGVVSVSGRLTADGTGGWDPEGCRLEIRGGTSQFDKFRYPVDRVSGSVVQKPGTRLFQVDLQGEAGGETVTMNGHIRDPGPAAEMLLTIQTPGLPLDDQFRLAWDPKSREIVDSMGVGGVASGKVVVYREPRPGAKTDFWVDARVRAGTLNYAHFPYALRRFSGRVAYASKNRSWVFEDLEGFRNHARVTGSGWINGEQNPPQLHLDVAVKDASFNRDLHRALGDDLQALWDHIEPSGQFDMDMDVDWATVGGAPPLISVPKLTLRGGGLKPESFPYRLDQVTAELRYEPTRPDDEETGRVVIERLVGRHGNTTVDAAGWADHRSNGDWTLHFDRLVAKNVVANTDLLSALPESLREAFQVLNPTAPFGIENTELEFRGRGDPSVPVTAAWYTETVLDGGAISAGMDLENVRGRVTNSGSYGPDGLINQGEVRLDSVEVLDHTLTNVRGPYRIVDTELIIGSPEVFTRSPQSVPLTGRITADAFTGRLTCDAMVSLSEPGAYRVFVTARDADLRTYATIHMPKERNMDGKMNGWIYLYGLGSSENDIKGSGQLQISPAAIYEMPVIVNLLNAVRLDLSVPDRVAFRYGLLNFRVMNSNFLFDQIDLVGNSISFRGRGRIGFDSRVNLDFYSKPPQSRGGVPILSQLVSGATSTWVHVKVGGTLDKSRTRVQPNINLDDALRPFLQAFDPRATVPQMRIPVGARQGRSAIR